MHFIYLSCSSATIYTSLRQYWGGGSHTDDYTPITMGMFATTRYWWSMGQMDPALQIWGGENVEISFRYNRVMYINEIEHGFVEVVLWLHVIHMLLIISVPNQVIL